MAKTNRIVIDLSTIASLYFGKTQWSLCLRFHSISHNVFCEESCEGAATFFIRKADPIRSVF